MKSVNLYLLILVSALASCNQMRFDKIEWNKSDDPGFTPPNRKRMLKDLTKNYKLTEIKYSSLINLLGRPNYADSTSLSYDIEVDYGTDIDPVYTKILDFIFDKDSIIKSWKIEEWKK